MPKEMLTNPELFVDVARSLKWKIDKVTAYSSKQPEKTGYDTRHINDIAPLIIDVSHLPAEEQEAAYDAEVKKMGAAFYTYDPATDRPYPDAVRPYIVAFFDRIRNITGSEMDWEDPKKIADILLAMKASQAIGTLVGDFQSVILDLYPDHDSITKFDASVSQAYMLYLKVGVAMARAHIDVEDYIPIGTKHLDSFDQDLQQQVIGAVYDATINGEDTVVLDPTVTDLAKKHFLGIPFSEMHFGGMAEYTNDDYLVDYMNRLSIAYSCTSVEQQMVGRINDGSNGAFNSYDLISINGRTIHEIIDEKVNGGSDKNTAEREAAQMFREALTDGKSVVDLMSVSYNKDGKLPYFLPVIGEYTGSATEYLQTDAVGRWGELIEVLEATVHSLRVCTANDPSCLYPFTEGNTHLVEGTFFTEEQIAQGEKVAIVSDLFAAQNGLSVGDTMELAFWRTNWMIYNQYVENKNTAMHQPSWIVGMHKSDYEELTQEAYAKPASRNNGSYTVVGIYQTNGFRDDFRYMHPNTVIVPQSVMYQRIGLSSSSYLNMTMIIPNGGAESLEAELSSLGTDLIETGYGGLIAYDDSGYSSIVPNVKAIRDGTQFVYKISLGLSCIVSLIALILFVSSLVSAGQIKYRLGVGRRRIWWQMTMASVPILILSGVIGCVGSVLLYGRATEWMLGAEFTSFDVSFSTVSDTAEMLEQIFSLLTQQTEFFMRIAALQVGILAAVTAVLCALIAWRRIGFQK